MKFFLWKKGRSDATKNLRKLTIWDKKWFDLYILSFQKGQNIDWHFDRVENKNHHRVNITLWGLWKFWYKKETEFFGHKKTYKTFSWHYPFKITKFRPDLTHHKAEIVKNSIVLSLGWCTEKCDV